MSLPSTALRQPQRLGGAISATTAAPIACGACLVAGAAAIAADDPASGRGLMPCAFRAATGHWCPGCGLTRATHHLLRGNIGQALSLNLFVVPILAGLVTCWFVWYRYAAGHGVPRRIRAINARVYAAAGVMLIGFAVVRNLSGFEVLRGG